MDQVSRPMQIALVAVVLFAAVYFVALKPKPVGGGGAAPSAGAAAPAAAASTPNAPGVAGLGRAIDKAHGAVATSQANADQLAAKSAQASGETTPAASVPAVAPAAGTTSTATPPVPLKTGVPAVPKAAPLHGAPGRAAAALSSHKVLAVLFYNPDATDDRAVRRDFLHLNRHKGRVVVVTAALSRLASFRSVLRKVAVAGSPTVLIFDRRGRAQSFVGFMDPAEIASHVDDALAVARRPG